MLSPKQILCLFFLIFMSTKINGNRTKRMYTMCPPKFFRIGSECYFISTDRFNWLDAHFECKDRNSRLAEPFKQEDRYLRKYLNSNPGPKISDIWIGGRFNWERNKWQWGYNGKDVTYQSFSQLSGDRKDLKFHCATLKPELKYRWSAESCVESHQYICQHRMPYVSAKNRQRVYHRWNETFPNEMANEIEVILSEDDLLRRRQRMQRQNPRRSNLRPNKNEQSRRQENALPFNELAQSANRRIHKNSDNSIRETRIDNNRQRNEVNRQLFELKLNRRQAGGIRKRIQFNGTNTFWHPKLSTIKTTTTQVPASSQPASYWSPGLTDEQIFEKQREERERLHYESHQRHIAQERIERQRLEKQRADEEYRAREKHQAELQRRHDQLESERKQILEDERVREEKRRQNDLNNLKNEENRRKLQETQQQLEEMRQPQTEQNLSQIQNDHNQQHYEIQTNEIDKTVTKIEASLKLKKEKANRIRDRLNHMTPEQQEEFFKQREERKKRKNGKRDVDVQQKTT